MEDEEYDKVCFKEYSKVCSEIIDGFLYLSGQDVASSSEILMSKGITHIVNAAGEICECYFPDKLEYLALNLRDNSNEVSTKLSSLRILNVAFTRPFRLLKRLGKRGEKFWFIVFKAFQDLPLWF